MVESVIMYTVNGMESGGALVSGTKHTLAAAIDEARLMKEQGLKEITIKTWYGRVYPEQEFDQLIKRG